MAGSGVSYGGDKGMVESSNSRGSTWLSQIQGVIHSTVQGNSKHNEIIPQLYQCF